jgi:hypothetical protein
VGTETKAAFDLATGTLTTTAGNVDSIAYKLTDKGNNQYQAEAIVLPNSKLPDDAAIEFTIAHRPSKRVWQPLHSMPAVAIATQPISPTMQASLLWLLVRLPLPTG